MYTGTDGLPHKVDVVKKAGYEKLSKPTTGKKWNEGTWVHHGKR
jgi:hypothetical protein